MRRVDAEGDSRGVRVQKQAEPRSRSRLRRAAIEWLERRELLSTSTSTLPSPTVLTPPGLLSQNAATVTSSSLPSNGGPALTAAPSSNSPSVAVDPINPLEMVAVWVDHDPTGYQPGDLTHPITNYIEGSYSLDGGQTWTALSLNGVNVQRDFSETPPTTSFFAFTQTTNASVAFDRSENFYILSSTHDDANDAGILDLERFSFTTANADAGNPPTSLSTTAVYTWDHTDSAAHSGTVDQVLTPTLAVDTNVPTYTDPTTAVKVTDPYSGNIYVAWGEEDSNTYGGIPNFNPYTIRMTASSNQGVDFAHDAYVDDSSNFNAGGSHSAVPAARYTAPQIAISQGNVAGTVSPGQVTLVYDDYGSQAPINRILNQSDTTGGTSQQFSPPAGDLGPSTFATATINNTTVITKQNLNTDIPITVAIPAKVETVNFALEALDVTTTIDYAAMADLTVELIPPTAVNTALKAINPAYPNFLTLYSGSLTGPNLGATAGTGFGAGSGTVFDPTAVRSIGDGNTGVDATGHFRPLSADFFDDLVGLSAATLNGTWNFLASYNPAVDTSTSLRYVNGVTLNFTAGDDPGGTNGGAETTIADKNTLYVVNVPNIDPTDPTAATGYTTTHHTDNTQSPYYDGVAGSMVTGNGTITAPTQGTIPLLPAPVIASDNTLGSFSEYEGRLYVAFTGMFTNAQADNTDIFLFYSTDGGVTWSNAQTVNDDNAAADGYSGAAPSTGNNQSLGRTQYQPQIAVDQSTGAVVVSYFDARNDPSDTRVATYISVSNDGAATWAASVYANPTETALDAVSGDTVNLGPVPDNESTGGGVQDTSGYGTHQALIVTNGQITAFWASNQDEVHTNGVKLSIVDSILSLAAGPIIVSSTQGPVGVAGDEVNPSITSNQSSDGTTMADTIQVTFDEPIDPSTFTASDVGVYYKSPAGGTPVLLPIVSGYPKPLDANQFGAVNFLIKFNPAQLANTTYGYVGTYSYVIYPVGNPNASPTGISDRIRHVISGGTIATGNLMDQNASGIPGQPHDDDYVVGQPTTVPVTYASTASSVAIVAGAKNVNNVIVPSTQMMPINVIDDYTLQPDNGVLPGVTLTLNITYPNDPDLAAFLLSPPNAANPAGVEVPLFTQIAKVGANFTTTTFSDLASTAIAAGTPPYTGSFQPQTTFNTFANNGATSLGTWELVIENFGITGTSIGTINSWSLTLQPPQIDYVTGTLPLIVSGPHLTSTVAVDNLLPYSPPAGTAVSNATGTASSSVTVSGLSNRSLTSGTLTATITAGTLSGANPPTPNVNNFAISLTLPGGQVIPVPLSEGVISANNTVVTFTLANLVGITGNTTPNGNYTLTVSDATGDETISISTWQVALKLQNTAPYLTTAGPPVVNVLSSASSPLTVTTPVTADVLTSATLTATITAGVLSGTNPPTPTVNNFVISLVIPGGQVIPVPLSDGVVSANNATVTFTLADLAGILGTTPLDGTYTLQVSDPTGDETISISEWYLALNNVQPFSPNVISSGNTNLVLNNTVGNLQVTFDRNIQINSFTPDQVLSIIGPAGSVSLTGLTITPLMVYTPIGQENYTGGGLVADVFEINFPAQEQLSGTYTVTLGTGIFATDTSGQDIGIDANLNAGLDTLKGTATNGVTTPVTYSATSPAVPAAISPATVINGTTTPSMLMSPIDVPIDFPIQGDVNGVSGVTLTLNISYPTDPNLIAYLVSPAGTQIRLFTNVGSGTNTANFTNTTFSDTAKTLISTAGAPFFGTFLPQEPFGTLNSNGEDSEGTWQLVIENEGNAAGTLNSWSLTFQKPTSSTGLAEGADDRSQTSFQIFNLAASNALANSTWTAVGPAGITTVGATTPVSFPTSSTVVPAVIPASGTLMSPINVNQDFAILGDSAAYSGVTLSLDVTNTTAASVDISAYLQAPNGTRINLFTNVVGPTKNAAGGTINYTGTPIFEGATLSDIANNPIAGGAVTFGGDYTPEALFNTLATDGLYTYGTWSLVITNSSAGAATLDDWSLTFQKVSSTISGEVSTVAVDPSDKTGNTVYVGTASGGVWKTNDFLTTNPAGPTYVPLTQFGPNFSLNIGSIAAIGVNADPSQTILFAGTGFGQETTTSNTGAPNVDLNSGRGVGILRSTDGGVTWTLLDSLINTDANGNELPESQRDHQFVGDTTYKIVVDPSPEVDGDYIVYAALGGPTGGFYQSLDSGNTWKLLSGTIAANKYVTCTDILLDPSSKSPTTGNLDTLYVAFSNFGVYVSSNQGQTLQQMTGMLGKDPLIVGPGFPTQPITVGNAADSPNNITGSYIVLAKPALTGNAAEDLAYKGWLFAAVENGNGTFNGLYVTKDNGENWTLVQLPNIPGTNSVKAAVPTNTTAGGNSYDPTSDQFNQEGTYNLTLTIDPTDPNIVYIGGSQNFQQSGMIRVDLTDLYDAHNFTSFSSQQTDAGALYIGGQGGVTVAAPANGAAAYQPIGSPAISDILNLRYAPTDPFNVNATLVVTNVGATGFVNTGTGVTWSLFDEPLKAEAGDTIGSTNVHDVIDYIDPITGNVRLLIADDEGIYTALVNSDGTFDNGIGTDFEANYSRNGNLQNEQLLDSAAQPSYVSTQAAGALFYASGQTDLAAQSDADILTDGNLTWDNSAVINPSADSPRNVVANSSIGTVDRSGVGVATDSTGESSPPNVYEFDIPILGGNLTDFFRVNQFGQTTGLANNVNQEYPRQGSNGDSQVSGYSLNIGAVNNGQIAVGNFEVNPLNGNQILIGSATGNLYETTNAGALWSPIGNPADFQVGQGSNTQIQFSTLAYAAPDPSAQGGVGNLNNFIYVGTTGSPLGAGQAAVLESDGLFQNDGRIFVTQAGGQGWMNISSGLDGSSVVGIYPDPDRGSHAAYAVTLTGVFYSPDTIGLEESGQTVWTNITSNLTSIQYNPFGNATYQQPVLAQFLGQNTVPTPNSNSDVFTAQYGGFTSIVADYRYEIPAPTNATEGTNIFYPVLYVSGYGGVFRSIDNGVTWTVFPNVAFDAAPVDGGYLPSVDVTNLQLVLGDINPATGHAIQATHDPEILLASTYGAGDYAIRLAPDVIPNSVVFDTTLPPPDGSDSSDGAGITNVLDPYLDGISEVSNYGDTVTINLYDEIPTEPNGTANPYFGTLLGTGTTNQLGQFVVEIIDSGQDPVFFASSTAYNDKIVGIRATDSSGASGNMTFFQYTLDLITPNTPDAPVLEAEYDTGRFSTDDLTNLSVPPQAGPGAPLSVITPVFDVTTPLPQANPLSPNPISLTIELLQATSPNGPFFVVNSTQTGFVNATDTAETYMLTDPTIAALAIAGIDETFYYEALQIDEAGNVSSPASDQLAITVDTIAPAAPTAITLDASTNSGGSNKSPYQTDFINPVFDVTGVLPNDQLLLYRSVNGGAPILVGTGPINNTASAATLQVTDTLGATTDGVYTYYAAQLDVYGNFSLLTAGIVVTINTQAPPTAPILEMKYDTGRFNNDDVTNIAVPAPTPSFVLPTPAPNFVVPVFDVNTVAPAAGQPAIAFVDLFRANSAAGPYNNLVGTVAFNGNPAMVTDASLQTLVAQEFAAGTPVDQTFYYEADEINTAGIASALSPDLAVVVDTVTPPTLPAPTLDPTSNTGLNSAQLITNQTMPFIDFKNLLPGEQAFLYRSSGGKAPILVGTGPINTTGADLNSSIQDTSGATPDGVYQYYVVEQDLAGNISNFSAAVAVTVNTTVPTAPTIALETSDDTGLPSHPNVTSVNTPHFVGTAEYNAGTNFPVDILTGETASSAQALSLNASGTVTSTSSALVIPASAQVVAGFVTVTLTNTSKTGGNNVGNLTVELLGPGGQTYFLLTPSSGITATSLTSRNFNLPASFLTGVLAGTYKLSISDATATDVGQLTSWSVTLLNGTSAGPTLLTPAMYYYPAANGTYLAQVDTSLVNGKLVTTALPDGVYTVVARTENQAGTYSYSAPLTVTILNTGPKMPPYLQILPADDTGIKGDNVTSNHNPVFIGTTDKGDTVSLYVVQSYVLVNGVETPVVAGPYATTSSSTINGSFSFQLPFNLTDGTTQLIAQTSDIANNKTVFTASQALTIQIVTTTGDYIGIGKAQLTVFDPYNETYYVRNIGSATVDSTPGRDVPMQYDLNGDGATDLVAYRFNTAEYYGYVTNNTGVDQQFGPGGLSLPVSGYYGSSGTFIYGSYAPATGTWYIALPQPGGLVVNFGVPKVDIPVPAAYNGYNSTELAVFRNTTVFGGDADSFSVIGPNGFYEVSFTSPAVAALGFTYKPGDIAAPADYDGIGRTEFAIYRPSTGQFFILNTPSDTNTATWTLRTVTLNLPGGPNVNDEPVSEDYDGDGKADPTVYRPSNSTFYMISSSTGLQSNIQFGPAGQSVAAAGPILYRLTALFGVYASGGGYYPIITTAGGEGGGGGVTALSLAPNSSGGGGNVRAESIASAGTSTSLAPASAAPGSPLSTMIAVAAPIAVTTTPTPTPVTPVVSLSTTPTPLVTVGASTPKTFVPVVTASKVVPTAKAKPKKETKPLVVDSRSHETEAAAAKAKAKLTAAAKSDSEKVPVKSDSAKAAAKSHTKAALLAATSLQHLVMAKKGGKKS